MSNIFIANYVSIGQEFDFGVGILSRIDTDLWFSFLELEWAL